jgi:predicted RNA-binding Zn-ribbon protein involved in translation (DUF1610 family)
MSTTFERCDRTGEDDSIHCPECGWAGDRRDLEMTKAALLQCPNCHDRS